LSRHGGGSSLAVLVGFLLLGVDPTSRVHRSMTRRFRIVRSTKDSCNDCDC
jgi:hypothetical protein